MMLSRKKKIFIIIFVGLIMSIAMFIVLFRQKEQESMIKEEVQKTEEVATLEEVVTLQKSKTDAEAAANEFADNSAAKLRVLSATPLYEEDGFSVVDMRFNTESGAIRGLAVTKEGSIVIPPNSDYTQNTIDTFGIPDGVIKALQEEVNSRG
jgi:sporulation protein YlmC with PRC-barrel domain